MYEIKYCDYLITIYTYKQIKYLEISVLKIRFVLHTYEMISFFQCHLSWKSNILDVQLPYDTYSWRTFIHRVYSFRGS